MSKIKPCPHCNHSADLFEYMAGKWKIACPICGATTWRWFDNQANAIKFWNNRPAESNLRTLLTIFVRQGAERVRIAKKKGQRQTKVNR